MVFTWTELVLRTTSINVRFEAYSIFDHTKYNMIGGGVGIPLAIDSSIAILPSGPETSNVQSCLALTAICRAHSQSAGYWRHILSAAIWQPLPLMEVA